MSSKELEEKAKAELKSSSTSGCGAFAAALHGMTLDGLVFTPRFPHHCKIPKCLLMLGGITRKYNLFNGIILMLD